MGWNQVRRVTADPLGDAIADGAHVYFVHSYHVVPDDRRVAVMDSEHGSAFCAAIRQDNIFAVQFHPEKSQKVGLALLEKFVQS
jgi:glutamine amidotransferase